MLLLSKENKWVTNMGGIIRQKDVSCETIGQPRIINLEHKS